MDNIEILNKLIDNEQTKLTQFLTKYESYKNVEGSIVCHDRSSREFYESYYEDGKRKVKNISVKNIKRISELVNKKYYPKKIK